MLTVEGRNTSESRRDRITGDMSAGGMKSPDRNLSSDLKKGQGDKENLLSTTLPKRTDPSRTEGKRKARSSPPSFSKESNIYMGHLPQIPLGPHVNLSAFGAGGVSGSQYQSIKQALEPIQTLVSVFGGPDIMCGIFPSTCLPRSRRRKRSPKRKSGKNSKNGGFKKPSSSGRKFRAKNLPHLFSAGGKFISGGLTGAQTVLGMVNGQQDRRMYHKYGQMPYRPQPPHSQSSPDYDH